MQVAYEVGCRDLTEDGHVGVPVEELEDLEPGQEGVHGRKHPVRREERGSVGKAHVRLQAFAYVALYNTE